MRRSRVLPAAVLVLCLFISAYGQNSKWDKLSAGCSRTYGSRDYPAAEQAFLEALKEAEKFGKKDQRLASTLNDLGSVYYRVVEILEKAQGPDNLEVATALDNYAGGLRRMNRANEAVKIEARAKAIRSK